MARAQRQPDDPEVLATLERLTALAAPDDPWDRSPGYVHNGWSCRCAHAPPELAPGDWFMAVPVRDAAHARALEQEWETRQRGETWGGSIWHSYEPRKRGGSSRAGSEEKDGNRPLRVHPSVR